MLKLSKRKKTNIEPKGVDLSSKSLKDCSFEGCGFTSANFNGAGLSDLAVEALTVNHQHFDQLGLDHRQSMFSCK